MSDTKTDDSLLAELRTTVARVLEIDESVITATARLGEDLALDSLMALEVMVALEKKYGVEFDEQEMKRVTCLQDMHDLLVSRLNGRADRP